MTLPKDNKPQVSESDPISKMLKLWQAHTDYEFVDKDVDATMKTMVKNPHVINVSVGIGGRGFDKVKSFYTNCFVGHCPNDVKITLLSRTVGTDRVVDEMIFSFTHDIEMPWILPGIPPTGKHVEIPLIAIVCVRDNLIESEHIYWDQASVLAQIGLLNTTKLPALGAVQARILTDSTEPLNRLIKKM